MFTSHVPRSSFSHPTHYGVVCSHRNITVLCVHIARITALFFSHLTYHNVFIQTITALFVHKARTIALFVPIALLQRSLFTSHHYSAFCSYRTYYRALCSHRTITALFVHIALLLRVLFTPHYYSALCSHRTITALCSHRTITARSVHTARITGLSVHIALLQRLLFTSHVLQCCLLTPHVYNNLLTHRITFVSSARRYLYTTLVSNEIFSGRQPH